MHFLGLGLDVAGTEHTTARLGHLNRGDTAVERDSGRKTEIARSKITQISLHRRMIAPNKVRKHRMEYFSGFFSFTVRLAAVLTFDWYNFFCFSLSHTRAGQNYTITTCHSGMRRR